MTPYPSVNFWPTSLAGTQNVCSQRCRWDNRWTVWKCKQQVRWGTNCIMISLISLLIMMIKLHVIIHDLTILTSTYWRRTLDRLLASERVRIQKYRDLKRQVFTVLWLVYITQSIRIMSMKWWPYLEVIRSFNEWTHECQFFVFVFRLRPIVRRYPHNMFIWYDILLYHIISYWYYDDNDNDMMWLIWYNMIWLCWSIIYSNYFKLS